MELNQGIRSATTPTPKKSPQATESFKFDANHYYLLGKSYYDKADLGLAEESFLRCLQVSKHESPTATSLFKVYGFLIRIYLELEQTEEAQVYIVRAQDLLQQVSESLDHLTAMYFYNEGLVKTYGGHYEEARQSFTVAMQKAQEENNPDTIANCLFALAQNSLGANDWDKMAIYLGQLAELLSIITRPYLRGNLNLLYGKYYTHKGDFTKAKSYLKGALSHFHKKKCWNMDGYIMMALGEVSRSEGRFSEATIYYDIAQTYAKGEFRRLATILSGEIADVNNANVDVYLDYNNRTVQEKSLGRIDFRHRFVLLEILFLLARNPGKSYDKEVLAQEIWKNEYNPLIHDKLIYTSISRLRKLIEPKNGAKRKYIVRSRDGYVFNPRVKVRFQHDYTQRSFTGYIDVGSPV